MLHKVERIVGFISIHALREEGDDFRLPEDDIILISIHALREEGDRAAVKSCTVDYPFLSTPSARRATRSGCGRSCRYPISIHALREEGDSKNGEKHLRFCCIIKRSAQIWKSFSKNIRKKSRDLHRMS